MEYFKAEVMEMCHRENLYQIDLLNGSKNRITEREYWAKRKGQAALDKENASQAATGEPSKQTKFETDKEKLRQTIRKALATAATFDDFSSLLLREGVTVKESRGRLSYACFMKRFTKHDEEWGTFIDIKQCSTPINKRRLNGKTVFLSSVTDCYNRYEETYCVTQNILRQLVSIDCTVNISTKSSLILRDIDLLKQFQNLTVSLSINTLDENFKNDMDDASSIIDRLNTLKALHENGIYTVLFMSPIFPMITDFREIIERSHLFVDEYWFENLNLRGNYKEKILGYIKSKYPQYADLYQQIYLHRKRGYWDKLAMEIEQYCNKCESRFKSKRRG